VWVKGKYSERVLVGTCGGLYVREGLIWIRVSLRALRVMVKLEMEEEAHPVALRSVIPGLHRSKKEKVQLEEDLR